MPCKCIKHYKEQHSSCCLLFPPSQDKHCYHLCILPNLFKHLHLLYTYIYIHPYRIVSFALCLMPTSTWYIFLCNLLSSSNISCSWTHLHRQCVNNRGRWFKVKVRVPWPSQSHFSDYLHLFFSLKIPKTIMLLGVKNIFA